MKYKIFILILLYPFALFAQEEVAQIKEDVTTEEIETHIRFLASDELMGRQTGTPGIDIAAAYIAAYYKAVGVKPLPGMDSYYQNMTLYNVSEPKQGSITMGERSFSIADDMITAYTQLVDITGEAVYRGYGTDKDLKKSIEGKIVILLPGDESGDYRAALSPSNVGPQLKKMEEKGAKAVIYLWNFEQLPWSRLRQWMGRGGLQTRNPADTAIPAFYVNAINSEVIDQLSDFKGSVNISFAGRDIEEVTTKNVVGYIEGSESSDEYVLLGAHYDHIGGEESDEVDKIYNGARDNAVGTAAVMMAGDYLAEYKPKRSVILAAWTAEEIGLIGSSYFVNNPPVPLENIVYNLNIDNGGYNDTTIVTVVGLERTMAEEALKNSTEQFGLKAISDPSPNEGLFDRSDNVNFARKGIPAPTFSLGFTSFDREIMKYYHQVEDEADSINYSYITKYTRAFVLAATKIANKETEIFWREGDKYEEAGKELYNK